VSFISGRIKQKTCELQRYLTTIQPRAQRSWMEIFTRGAATDLSLLQHSPRKWPLAQSKAMRARIPLVNTLQ